MALDFPANPSDGEVFGSYVWSASKAVWQSREESAAPAVVSPVPPASATPGDIWVDSSDGISYVYYDDGSSGQWIEMISSGVVSLASKANLDGGNAFTGTQNFETPISVTSGGTGTSTLASGGYLKGTGTLAITSQTGIPAEDITSGTLSQDRGGTGQSTLLAAIQNLGIGDYAAKSGPSSYVAPYRVNWAKGYGIGSSLNWLSYADGIYVNTTGHYEVWGVQRGAQTNYSGIGISGNRTTLENRTNGIWSHDHAGDDSGQGWSKSYFLGELYAGELVTFGGAANNMSLSTAGFAGFLTVKRLR
jgi:hypothetical protein